MSSNVPYNEGDEVETPHERWRGKGAHLRVDRDLLEMLRLKGNVADARSVVAEYLERNGETSVLPRRMPQVVEVDVSAGVQTVRIVL